ncbi:MAG: hypothetical protein K6B40_00965 [Firmicutes bacterium]|nr:hypothetical protein [Bacillota bacterium]
MMKKSNTGIRLVAILIVLLMLFAAMPITALAASGGRTLTYGDYVFTKVSNPSTVSGEADGINTDDITGYPANRLNSYAWAVGYPRGQHLYRHKPHLVRLCAECGGQGYPCTKPEYHK